jgi:hypothetical protein
LTLEKICLPNRKKYRLCARHGPNRTWNNCCRDASMCPPAAITGARLASPSRAPPFRGRGKRGRPRRRSSAWICWSSGRPAAAGVCVRAAATTANSGRTRAHMRLHCTRARGGGGGGAARETDRNLPTFTPSPGRSAGRLATRGVAIVPRDLRKESAPAVRRRLTGSGAPHPPAAGPIPPRAAPARVTVLWPAA